MADLKPCPFCGGEAEKLTSIDGFTSIGCLNCNPFYGVMIQRNTEAEAIAAWNTRAERTCRSTTDDSAWCFVCSECGKSFPRNKLHLAHNHGEINYCPNCGAKVVGE